MAMTENRLLIRTFLLGGLLTLMVMVVKAAGVLVTLEHWIYDQRIKYFQNFTPAPSPLLVHLDMDDAALETIGRWPWPRGNWAEIIDELRLTNPKVIALDVFFSEPEKEDWRPVGPATPPTTNPVI